MKFPYNIIDLTHALTPGIPTWDGDCGFVQTIKCDYSDCTTEVKFRTQEIKMKAGIGTHLDAPLHCFLTGKPIEELELENLIAPCVMIDVSSKVHEEYEVHQSDIEEFEKKHGIISPESFVIIHTGWGKFWNQPKKYRNNLLFPSISKQAATYLLERQIVGLGIDTLSPDCPKNGYPVHCLLLGAGKYIVENVAHAHTLPAIGSYSCVLPLKTMGATEAPVRLIALINK